MNLGFAITGSFCTLSDSVAILKKMVKTHSVTAILSDSVQHTDTRFAVADDIINTVSDICGKPPILSIKDAEPLGPISPLDALIICPCTGNTLAKLANGITDTPVTMAAKAHMRNNRPLIISLATNDALSQNLANLGTMLNRKSVFFVPLGQDSPDSKPHSLVANLSMIENTLELAMKGKQIQPLFICSKN